MYAPASAKRECMTAGAGADRSTPSVSGSQSGRVEPEVKDEPSGG